MRFYFKYNTLASHPHAVNDGFLPLKVKDEVVIKDYVYAVIVPMAYKDMLEDLIPDELKPKTYYIENDCRDIWEWSEKVYSFVERL